MGALVHSRKDLLLLSCPSVFISPGPTGRVYVKFDIGGFKRIYRQIPDLVKIGQNCYPFVKTWAELLCHT